MNPRTLVLSWLRSHTRGRPSDASVTIPVSELLGLEEQLEDAPKGGKGSRLPRKQKGMTSRSKQRKRQDTEYLAFVRRHPCCSCGSTRDVEAHHASSGKAQKGMGMKVPDNQTVPLCRHCHQHFHDTGSFPTYHTTGIAAWARITINRLQSEWAELQSNNERTF